jgi:thiamine pyrophosphokinase
MNFYLITYAVSYVKVNEESIKEDIVWCKFLDTDNFINSNLFLSQLKLVKKLRITGVKWEIEDCNWYDIDEVSNTIH